MSDFFISYNRADEDAAEWIAWTLRDAGYSVRFAKWELSAGSIAAWMKAAIEECDRLIAVCSPDYFDPKARYSEMEREAFYWAEPDHFGRTILPVIVRDTRVPKYWAHYLRIDLTNADEDAARDRLVNALAFPERRRPLRGFGDDVEKPASAASDDRRGRANTSFFGWPGVLLFALFAYMVLSDLQSASAYFSTTNEFSRSPIVVMVAGALLFTVTVIVNAGLNAPDSRRWLATTLHLDRGAELYRLMLLRLLQWVDAALAPRRERDRPGDGYWRTAWSGNLFNSCLMIAFIYPLYSVFAIWMTTNATGWLGEVTLAHGDQELWRRAATFGGLCGVFVFGQLARWRRRSQRGAQAKVLFAASFGSAALACFTSASAGTPAVAAAFGVVVVAGGAQSAVALAAVISIAVAFGAPLGARYAGDLASTFPDAAGAFVVVIALLSILTVALLAIWLIGALWFAQRRYGRWALRSSEDLIAGLLGYAAVSAIIVLVLNAAPPAILGLGTLFAVLFVVSRSLDGLVRWGRSISTRAVAVDIVLITTAAVLILIASTKMTLRTGATFIISICLLPLLNALFDFLSIGLTRYCLKKSVGRRWFYNLMWSLADLTGAILLMIGLVIASILLVHYVRDASGAPLTDINSILRNIQQSPESYLWLYVTYFSTLLPTLCHLALVCFSFITLSPAPLQRAMASWIRQMDRNGFAALGAKGVVPVMIAVSIAAPFVALYGLWAWFVTHHSDIGWTLFKVVVAFAGALDPAYVTGLT